MAMIKIRKVDKDRGGAPAGTATGATVCHTMTGKHIDGVGLSV